MNIFDMNGLPSEENPYVSFIKEPNQIFMIYLLQGMVIGMFLVFFVKGFQHALCVKALSLQFVLVNLLCIKMYYS